MNPVRAPMDSTNPNENARPAGGAPDHAVAGHRGPDRRARATPRLSRYSFKNGRRRAPRRGHELEGSFVDLYGHGLLFAVMWVALMNTCDSFFTIVHLQNGGVEANPIAGALLLTGRFSFVLIKSSVISLALLVLCLHKNFHLARLGLWTAAIAYTCLLAYHLILFAV